MKNLVKWLKVNIEDINCGKFLGAFYAFPNIKKLPISFEELADYVLAEAGVITRKCLWKIWSSKIF
ncbi:MAG: hypothetical protein F6K24_42995 [Okeania sp. SIO2D1]|nr:hypothetical protein [Okeania sp. SIO2D1]